MRLSNHKLIKIIPGIYCFSVIPFLFLIFLKYPLYSQLFLSDKYYSASIIIIEIWLVYIYFVKKYLKYDSEKSFALYVKQGDIWSEFINHKTKIYETVMEKISRFKFCNILFYNYLNSFYSIKNSISDICINKQMLSPEKARYLKLSLDKIIVKNQSRI